MVVAATEHFYGFSDPWKSVCRVSRHDFGPNTLGILAFETAKTMSRLLSLYRSLSDDEVDKLQKEVMKSPGVSYLNSEDEDFLLHLAYAERIEELDGIASAVSRLGRKCVDFGFTRFDLVYNDMKDGMVDLWKIQYKSKNIDKALNKMKKLISTTASLHLALQCLSEMEVSERRLQTWNQFVCQQTANLDYFNEKIAWQRKEVRILKEESLWSQTFDQSVALMARIVCIVYARICDIFRSCVDALPHQSSEQKIRFRLLHEHPLKARLGSIQKGIHWGVVHFHNREYSKLYFAEQIGLGIGTHQHRYLDYKEMDRKTSVSPGPPTSTLGGSGLALLYAKIIILSQRYFCTRNIPEGAREDLYHMLPESLKILVGAKLEKGGWLGEEDELLVEGWRLAVMEILKWLAPMAYDTVLWQSGRSLEIQNFEARSSVLLLQTLYYSDREKAEAAIAEVLVGLSHMYQCRASARDNWY